MATHSSILAWRSPWTKEPGRDSLWSWTQLSIHTHTHSLEKKSHKQRLCLFRVSPRPCDITEDWSTPAQAGCMRQVLGPGALGRPRGIRRRGRWVGGSGWGTHVTPWLIHVNVWQNPLQYCKVISLQLIKKKKADQALAVTPWTGGCGPGVFQL